MDHQRVQRRLAAIVAADVVGYSRLMGHDEVGTRQRFNACYEGAIVPCVKERHGRIIKTMGDGVLIEFASAVDAVRCAVEFQTRLQTLNTESDEARRMTFRVGVNLGDVILEGDDIHGDGVNVAARLEGLAEPGGVVISGIVHEIVRSKLGFGFDDLGPQDLKNIDGPIRAFRAFAGDGATADALGPEAIAPSLPDGPSIVVLPFVNNSSDPEQQYFADGITEDLITDLSKVQGLYVVARNSSFAFKDESSDVRDIARRLGVQHLLEGSVRRGGTRVRINARLVHGATARQLWADRYDRDFDDIFSLQDEITARIVSALDLHLSSPQADAGGRQRTRNSEAYNLCLKGRSEYYAYTPAHLAKAQHFFEQAIALDPLYSEAYSYLSYCRTSAFVFAWPGADKNLGGAKALAEKAVALDSKSAVAHARLGWINGFLACFDDAIRNFETAVAIDPRNAEVYYAYGETMNRRGTPERALPLLEKAFSIDTFVPPGWEFAKGHSYILMRRFDEALEYILPVIERVPQLVPARVQVARAYGEMGRISEGEAIVRSILEIAPNYRLASARRMFPYPQDEDRLRLENGLRKAGLPE